MKSLFRKALHYFNLEPELENNDLIHEEILRGIPFKGTNLWILVFAIFIASVGLNMNSTAVIIGAMLISPLMGPINGMGYSIATYNFELFRSAIKNFTFAVIASLVTSTIYFSITPISTAYSELLARTSPTIYDVLVALFGGLAGIVALSSKQKGNVVPGVAIATALMPPLCTAGYGLATAQFDFFFGAFYLFTINTVFIALASVAVSQLLKFPIRTVVEPAQRIRVNRYITGIIAIVLLPSIYFGYILVQKEKFTENAKRFVSSVSSYEGNYLLSHEIDAGRKSIVLVYGGTSLTKSQQAGIAARILPFGIDSSVVSIRQGLIFEEMDERNAESIRLKQEILVLQSTNKEIQSELDSIGNIPQTGKLLLRELKALFPEITACSYANTIIHTPSGSEAMPLLLIKSSSGPVAEENKRRIEEWARNRLQHDRVKVVFE